MGFHAIKTYFMAHSSDHNKPIYSEEKKHQSNEEVSQDHCTKGWKVPSNRSQHQCCPTQCCLGIDNRSRLFTGRSACVYNTPPKALQKRCAQWMKPAWKRDYKACKKELTLSSDSASNTDQLASVNICDNVLLQHHIFAIQDQMAQLNAQTAAGHDTYL